MKGWKGKAFLKSHFCQSLNPERQFCKSLNPQNPSAMQTRPQRERESDFARWKKARGRRQEKPPVGSRCYRRLSRSHGRLGRVWEAYGPQHWAGGYSILRGGEAGPSKGPDTQRSVGTALGQQGAGAWARLLGAEADHREAEQAHSQLRLCQSPGTTALPTGLPFCPEEPAFPCKAKSPTQTPRPGG